MRRPLQDFEISHCLENSLQVAGFQNNWQHVQVWSSQQAHPESRPHDAKKRSPKTLNCHYGTYSRLWRLLMWKCMPVQSEKDCRSLTCMGGVQGGNLWSQREISRPDWRLPDRVLTKTRTSKIYICNPSGKCSLDRGVQNWIIWIPEQRTCLVQTNDSRRTSYQLWSMKVEVSMNSTAYQRVLWKCDTILSEN